MTIRYAQSIYMKTLHYLIEYIDSEKGIDILKLSSDFHYNLVNIHPFGDGNGRTSRIMMNYIQLYHNYHLYTYG